MVSSVSNFRKINSYGAMVEVVPMLIVMVEDVD